MPTHDPSSCPRCCWLAKREGWTLKYVTKGGAGIQAYLDKDGRAHFEHPSFCPSLDAVAGLMKDMQEHGIWCHRWVPKLQLWLYSSHHFGLDKPHFTSPEDLPAACVITAAMQVLDP